MVSASIVLFKTPAPHIERLLNCLKNCIFIDRVIVIDNSPYPSNLNFNNWPFVEYIKSDNCGYGAAHNLAIKRVMDESKFHFVLNPDIYFEPGQLEKLMFRISRDIEIGLLMPKVLYPNGAVQFLCKLLPTPLNLLIRRFPIPLFSKFINKINSDYELRFTGYSQEINSPTLSGCFMLLRVSALKSVGLFDERYFMYAEDIDLSRRIHASYKTIFFPDAIVYHEYGKTSYKNYRALFLHISSVIKYFNKWGWFIDRERKSINNKILSLYDCNGDY